MKVEICVHCWRYSRLLCYQLSSLRLNLPSAVEVAATVFHSVEDEDTVKMLDWFAAPLAEVGVRLNPWPLPRSHLLRRSIGRHEAAKATAADWIWMTDADYLFGRGCLDATPQALADIAGPLAFPRFVHGSRSRGLGDRAIEKVEAPGVLDIDAADFRPRRMRRAIGGVQIYRGDDARVQGYLPPGPNGHRPVAGETFRRCRGDVRFRRRRLRTPGVAVDIPHTYRIRHSQYGRKVTGLRL